MLSATTPLVTEAARYVLGLSIAACFVATGVSIALWNIGRRSAHTDARTRGLLGMLIALVAVTLVLLLALIYVL